MQNRILCPVADELKQVNIALARVIVQLDELKRNGGIPPENYSIATGASPLIKLSCPSVPSALDDFMTFKKSEVSGPSYDWYQEKLWLLYERFNGVPVNTLTNKYSLDYKTWLRYEK